MSPEKKNRRVQESKKKIHSSLIKLADQYGIDAVTIKDICEDADINRSTFYMHYEDLQALINEIENEFANHIIEGIQDYHYDTNSLSSYQNFFQTIKDNSDLLFFIFSPGSSGSGWEIIRSYLKERTVTAWSEHSTLSEEQTAFAFDYYMSGMFAVLKDWYSSDFAMSVDQLSDFMEQLSKFGIYHYVQLNSQKKVRTKR